MRANNALQRRFSVFATLTFAAAALFFGLCALGCRQSELKSAAYAQTESAASAKEPSTASSGLGFGGGFREDGSVSYAPFTDANFEKFEATPGSIDLGFFHSQVSEADLDRFVDGYLKTEKAKEKASHVA